LEGSILWKNEVKPKFARGLLTKGMDEGRDTELPDGIEEKRAREVKAAARDTKRIIHEPILKVLLENSSLTEVQLETLLIDLVVEDRLDTHISYEDKATVRTKSGKSSGVSRGAFNRTLSQARKNVMRCLYSMLLLAYLDLFELAIFRPFEEVASKIGTYRTVRDSLAAKTELSSEDMESYRAIERSILDALNEIASPLVLKSDMARKRTNDFED
jgi:hypothetical protein